jgi:hypothetical protein
VAVLDVGADKAQAVAQRIGGLALAGDITDSASVRPRSTRPTRPSARPHPDEHRRHRHAKRVVGKDGSAARWKTSSGRARQPAGHLQRGCGCLRRACAKLDPLADGERGVMVITASVAAFDGQVGQQAYSAPARAAWSA